LQLGRGRQPLRLVIRFGAKDRRRQSSRVRAVERGRRFKVSAIERQRNVQSIAARNEKRRQRHTQFRGEARAEIARA
jgi:hypothetical protein